MRINSESGWCDSAPEGERARECREGTWGKARGGGEKPPRKWTRSEREVWEI